LKRLFIVILVLLNFTSQAQTGNFSVDKLAVDYAKLSYHNVIENSKNLLRKEKSLNKIQTIEVLSKLANSLYNINYYKQAEGYFARLLTLIEVNKENADILRKYAQVLSGNGKNSMASQIWQSVSLVEDGNQRAKDFSILQANPEPLFRNAESYEIHRLGINTSHADFSPVRYEGGLVFVSSRASNTATKRVFAWDDSPFLDLFFLEDEGQLKTNTITTTSLSFSTYSASKTEKTLGSDSYTRQTPNDGLTIGFNSTAGSFVKPEIHSNLFSSALNSIYHEGPCAFYNKDRNIIFTRNGVKKLNLESSDELNRIHLFLAEKKGNEWVNLSSFPFNNSEYSTGHPAFMPDEKFLFFVSDMPGGYGGTDLYVSKFENGSWFKPTNAGPAINTNGNEMFPYIDESNVLYFASNGHPGLGGLDTFSTPLNELGFSIGRIRNLGSPINSASDDFGILTNSELEKGYFSSNRKNGGSDDDIYSFNRIGQKFACKDVLLAVKNSEGKAMDGLEFKFHEIASIKNYQDGRLDKKGENNLCLNSESEYYFEIEINGYDPVLKKISTSNLSDFKITYLDIILNKVHQSIEPEKDTPKVLGRERDLSMENRYKGIIYGKDRQSTLEGVKIRFINKCTGLATEFVTEENGKYDFNRNPYCDYEFIAMKTDFAANYEFIPMKKTFISAIKSTVSSNKKTVESFFDPKIFKVGDVVKMDNIYYELKDFELASNAKKDLDQLILVMEKYPEMVIEIFSHTDARGNNYDNFKLSQKRADEVKGYLSKKGIASPRIRAVGIGENQPVNLCSDGVQCTEAEYRRNRRTEFKILQIERI
jgi:outer membrane protein OmpA-like peptidoglycan-associated protein